jgi:uncharacterized membrane protein
MMAEIKKEMDILSKNDYNFNLFLFVTFCGFFNAFIPLIVKIVSNY